MPLQPRHAVASLAVAFLVGTVGGGILLSGGGDTASGSSIPFTPDVEEVAAPKTLPAKAAVGAFTTEAVKEGRRIVLSGKGAAPGASLVVQRKEGGGWQDFPARARADGDGNYSTYIITSHGGSYRVKDTGSDAASKPVNVDV